MSIDLHAHFDLTRPSQPDELIRQLRDDCPNLRRALMQWHPYLAEADARGWERMDKAIGDAAFCIWVPNWIVSVWSTRAELYQGTRWSAIWSTQRYRHLLRWACFDLAKVFGSDAAIYLPEMVHVEGETLAEVLRYLQTKAGAPAATIEAMREADEADDYLDAMFTGKGSYFIDHFDDLPQPPEAVPDGPKPPPDFTTVDWPHTNWPPEIGS
jgi:hypothetical protein